MQDDFTFGKPGSAGDQFKSADNLGRLVAFVEPSLEDVDTKFGEAEAAKVRYAIVLDGADAGSVYENTLVFGKALAPAVYANGESAIVLGRIAMGTAKAGQNAPYILEDASEDDEKAAGAWFSQNASRNAAGRIVISG